jgi:hypothetical protein
MNGGQIFILSLSNGTILQPREGKGMVPFVLCRSIKMELSLDFPPADKIRLQDALPRR